MTKGKLNKEGLINEDYTTSNILVFMNPPTGFIIGEEGEEGEEREERVPGCKIILNKIIIIKYIDTEQNLI